MCTNDAVESINPADLGIQTAQENDILIKIR
jgi:hypothetical protein